MLKNILIRYLIPFTLLIFVLLKIFLYIDVENSCYIFTVPAYLPSNLSTRSVIKLIKNASPDYYLMLCSDIRVINKNVSCGGFDGGCYEERKPDTIFLGNDQNNLGLSTAIVIHELCHRQQAKENRPFSELECYKEGSEFLEDIVVY